MSCEKYQDIIIESFGDENLPDEIKSHISECGECQKLLAELNEVTSRIGSDADFELSTEQFDNCLDAIEEKIDNQEIVNSKSNIWRVYVPAAAAVFLLVTVSLVTSWMNDPVVDSGKKTDTLMASVEKNLIIDISGDSWNSLMENSSDLEDYYDGMLDADLSDEEFQYLSDNFNVGEIL